MRSPCPPPQLLYSLNSSGGTQKNGIQRLLSVLVIICCGLLMTVAVFGLIDFNYANVLNYSDLFVSIYMLLFGGLLFTYELMWWGVIPIPALNKSMRKNFGFLYGVKGKALFIVFVAFLNFGLTQEIRIPFLALGTGIFFFVVAIFHLFLAFWKPELFGTYQAPTQGLTDSPV
jgi:hypothetical protein